MVEVDGIISYLFSISCYLINTGTSIWLGGLILDLVYILITSLRLLFQNSKELRSFGNTLGILNHVTTLNWVTCQA